MSTLTVAKLRLLIITIISIVVTRESTIIETNAWFFSLSKPNASSSRPSPVFPPLSHRWQSSETTPPPSTPIGNSASDNNIYFYFGYGSNVLPSTMKALRQIEPINASAAVIPGYQLKFYGFGAETASWPQLVKSSAAFVEPAVYPGTAVHGVLYALSATDFARVGLSEGVPLAYRWEQCYAYQYVGNGRDAGRKAMSNAQNADTKVKAYILGVPRSSNMKSAAPSSSYLGLIQQGARLWGMDEDYQQMLETVPVATNRLLGNGDGISGITLQVAEKLAGIDRTHGIPPLDPN